MRPTLSTYRAILRELRWLKLQNPMKSDIISYISKEFKSNKTTDEKFCRASESAVFKAKTYLTLLESTRKNQMLTELYKGRGDKTTEQAANTVGLTLPKTFQDPG
ncbi:hypothetical protein RvY_05752 [Ramazzottius varieornatus]|uniref:Protein FMC1 homolog n=1 Tax=Ramazzottius varieornatus TaxID=947166 RepID=A0A1D1UW48_RAMVA|nr:hypothetical protein RvY_05752 [Ramazzottius varieornatus]